MGRRAVVMGLMAGMLGGVATARAENCVTQAAMPAAERDGLAAAARGAVEAMQRGDAAAVEGMAAPELRQDFAGARGVIAETSGALRGDALMVEQVYLLDATGLAAGTEAQFFCTLSRVPTSGGGAAEVDFSLRGLRSGVYGFAVVTGAGMGAGTTAYRVSLLLEKSGAGWQVAGFFPGATQAGGHDGVWYWKEARRLEAAKQPWSAWLLYGEARTLLDPAPFMETTHLERLEEERKTGAPPALSGGLNGQTPLVIRGADGKEFRVTGLTTQPGAGGGEATPLSVLVTVEGVAGDAAAVRAQSDGAARALVAAYPELRTTFGGVLTSLEVQGQSPLVTSRPMSALR